MRVLELENFLKVSGGQGGVGVVVTEGYLYSWKHQWTVSRGPKSYIFL